MAGPSTEEPRSTRRRARAAVVIGLVGLAIAIGAVVTSGDGGDRVALRSAGPGEGEPRGTSIAPEEGSSSTTSSTDPTTTTTTTTTSAPTVSTPTTAPATTAPAATAAPAPPPPPAPTTGTLALELTPPEEGWKKDVWVSGPDGATVLPSTPVTGPIVIEGLAPGAYEVFVSQQGPPYGPDENGVELGGGSQVVRLPADVAAGGTTTVPDPEM